ncbi:cyclase family protein [Actinophytocola sp.]|uniref:cyclase family protein n=1 Tax=Actinophytocola sp. TaxID=1872138 RepID=UPI003D6C104D
MRTPSREEIMRQIDERRNWGRWGPDDQVGAVNLVVPDKVRQAAALVTSGERISLSRPLPVTPAPNNVRPVGHFMERRPRGRHAGAGVAADVLFATVHGAGMTHLDALCHTWGPDGMWNGRDPDEMIEMSGVRWGGIEHWRDGIVTKGVLVDVPGHRGAEYVSYEEPVGGDELVEIVEKQGCAVEPGDALVVYCGRDRWEREHSPWGSRAPADMGRPATGTEQRPGLHASCLRALRDWDVAMLVWDMLDYGPNGYDIPWSVHAAIHSYGVALVDNALLEPLADACRAAGRHEFMLTVAPLVVVGGTGSPVNPIAVL